MSGLGYREERIQVRLPRSEPVIVELAVEAVPLDPIRVAVLAAYRFESGLVAFGTFDPFDLESISFTSGGFGALHGDALARLLELSTAGVPPRREMAATASLGAVAARLHVPLDQTVGIRLTANRSSTELMHRLNGHDTDFLRVPESRNAGGSLTWRYGRDGRVKLYGYDEWNRFAVRMDAPSHEGGLHSGGRERPMGDVGIRCRGPSRSTRERVRVGAHAASGVRLLQAERA